MIHIRKRILIHKQWAVSYLCTYVPTYRLIRTFCIILSKNSIVNKIWIENQWCKTISVLWSRTLFINFPDCYKVEKCVMYREQVRSDVQVFFLISYWYTFQPLFIFFYLTYALCKHMYHLCEIVKCGIIKLSI